MDLWTKRAESDTWERPRQPIEGLAELCNGWCGALLLVSAAPDEELGELRAAIRIARRLCPERVTIIAGTDHPSSAWVRGVRAAGVDRVWHLAADHRRRSAAPAPTPPAPSARGTAVPAHEEVDRPVCPSLHTKTGDRTTLSVCGRRHDRLVLPHRDVERRCLRDYERCARFREAG